MFKLYFVHISQVKDYWRPVWIRLRSFVVKDGFLEQFSDYQFSRTDPTVNLFYVGALAIVQTVRLLTLWQLVNWTECGLILSTVPSVAWRV